MDTKTNIQQSQFHSRDESNSRRDKRASRRGQTLVEALVALTILTSGFLGITTLLTKSFQLNRISTNDTQATYLASEGIEVAKSLIDHDVYYGLATPHTDDWGECFPLGRGASADYEFQYNTIDTLSAIPTCPTAVPAATANSTHLYFDSVNHLYSYNKGVNSVNTNFTRDVKITMPAADYPNEIDVQSIVTWNTNGLSNTITLEDQFYNWHPANN
jgi:Prokaryotic N-terminal methylation motif